MESNGFLKKSSALLKRYNGFLKKSTWVRPSPHFLDMPHRIAINPQVSIPFTNLLLKVAQNASGMDCSGPYAK